MEKVEKVEKVEIKAKIKVQMCGVLCCDVIYVISLICPFFFFFVVAFMTMFGCTQGLLLVGDSYGFEQTFRGALIDYNGLGPLQKSVVGPLVYVNASCAAKINTIVFAVKGIAVAGDVVDFLGEQARCGALAVLVQSISFGEWQKNQD